MKKSIILKILGMLIVTIMLLQTTSVFAANVNDLNNQKASNQEKINETQKEKEEVAAEKKKVTAEVEKLNTQITEYENQIYELDSKISDLNSKISESQSILNKAEEDYTNQQKLLESRLIAIQEAGETSYLDFLLSSEDITDLISNYYLISEIATNDTQLLEKIQKQKEEIKKAKEELESSKRELDTSKASKESVSVQLKTAKNDKDKQVAQLSEDEKKLQAKLDELKQANRSIDSQIKAEQENVRKYIEEQNRKKPQNINNAKTQNNQAGGTTKSGSSGFIYPVPSGYTRVTTGMYYSSGSYHGAIDFGCSGINGQPVYAVADGYVVTSTRLSGSYGNYILIAHANGLYTLYAHGQDGSRTVSAGQTVTQGQQIMRVGSTGNSSGPHLHFEVRTSPGTYSNRQNPLNYL